MTIRAPIIAIALLSMAACASHEAPQVVTVDHVAARKASIAEDQKAGDTARRVCGELGLQGNVNCEEDIARAALKIGPAVPLPMFTKISD